MYVLPLQWQSSPVGVLCSGIVNVTWLFRSKGLGVGGGLSESILITAPHAQVRHGEKSDKDTAKNVDKAKGDETVTSLDRVFEPSVIVGIVIHL
jgi:hypothetical protein